jgi:ABC-2 type transport system ATP-binding protein
MKITIAVNHLYLKKGHTDILDNVSFTVPSGVVCAFIGHNGAGKTTTIKSILNLRPYNSGTVKINGIDSKNIKSRESVGYIPEKAIAVNMNTKVFIKEMAQYHK